MNKLLLIFILLIAFQAQAQFADSLKIQVGTTATLASKNYQPLWIVANRYGTLTDRQADLATHFSVSNEHVFTRQTGATEGVGPVQKRGFYM